jgi:uncharacterized membrane protein YagU involved in acid resistance
MNPGHANGQLAEPLKGLCAGLAGGLAGTIVMTGFQMMMMEAMEELANGGSEESRSEPATEKAALAVSEGVLGIDMTRRQREIAGQFVHFGFGATMGGIYGVICEFLPQASRGAGLPFGTILMLAADEVAVPALGLGPPPAQTPASKHLYALAAHLVYGFAAEAGRRVVRAAL